MATASATAVRNTPLLLDCLVSILQSVQFGHGSCHRPSGSVSKVVGHMCARSTRELVFLLLGNIIGSCLFIQVSTGFSSLEHHMIKFNRHLAKIQVFIPDNAPGLGSFSIYGPSKVSVNERRYYICKCYMCNSFSHWLRIWLAIANGSWSSARLLPSGLVQTVDLTFYILHCLEDFLNMYVHTFFFKLLPWHWNGNTSCWNPSINDTGAFLSYKQYQDCWCPGDARSQVTSSHLT